LGMLGFDPETIAEKANSYTLDDVTNGVDKLSVDGKNAADMSAGTEDMVKKALMVGNFEAAVECCFRTGNLADALLLASCGGAELWQNTQQRYFQAQSGKRSFLPLVSAVIQDGLVELVQNSDLKDWKDTLAILSTYGKAEEFPTLCVDLGDLLEKAGDDRNASLCFMCSLSLGRAGKFWRQQLEAVNKVSSFANSFLDEASSSHH
jgi:protein transport protein SEC31